MPNLEALAKELKKRERLLKMEQAHRMGVEELMSKEYRDLVKA